MVPLIMPSEQLLSTCRGVVGWVWPISVRMVWIMALSLALKFQHLVQV